MATFMLSSPLSSSRPSSSRPSNPSQTTSPSRSSSVPASAHNEVYHLADTLVLPPRNPRVTGTTTPVAQRRAPNLKKGLSRTKTFLKKIIFSNGIKRGLHSSLPGPTPPLTPPVAIPASTPSNPTTTPSSSSSSSFLTHFYGPPKHLSPVDLFQIMELESSPQAAHRASWLHAKFMTYVLLDVNSVQDGCDVHEWWGKYWNMQQRGDKEAEDAMKEEMIRKGEGHKAKVAYRFLYGEYYEGKGREGEAEAEAEVGPSSRPKGQNRAQALDNVDNKERERVSRVQAALEAQVRPSERSKSQMRAQVVKELDTEERMKERKEDGFPLEDEDW